MPALEIEDLVIRYGKVTAVENFSVVAMPGQHVTFVGPSGCGKTTTLRAIAGLETPSAGSIKLFGRTVFDGKRQIDVPANQRDLSMVFQSYAIWPHMTVFENVAYGLRLRKVREPQLTEKVMRALEMVGLADYARRQAPQLSGGQQQRVALARSFAFDPKILLFDEPLSNLDAKLRTQMRSELKELSARLGITSIYVTHDQEEALSLSDVVLVMKSGHIQQKSDPMTAYLRPANAFVADFIGASNLVPVTAGPEPDTYRAPSGELVWAEAATMDHVASVAIKSAHLRLSPEPPVAADNVWKVTVKRALFVGDMVEYDLDWGGVTLRAREVSTAFFDAGTTIYASPLKLHVQPLPDLPQEKDKA